VPDLVGQVEHCCLPVFKAHKYYSVCILLSQ
jgi:hypothetical protein